jgi:hypothetical protein
MDAGSYHLPDNCFWQAEESYYMNIKMNTANILVCSNSAFLSTTTSQYPEKSVHDMEALFTHVHQHIFFPFLCTLTPSQLIVEFPHEYLLLPVVPDYNALVRYHAPIVTVS